MAWRCGACPRARRRPRARTQAPMRTRTQAPTRTHAHRTACDSSDGPSASGGCAILSSAAASRCRLPRQERPPVRRLCRLRAAHPAAVTGGTAHARRCRCSCVVDTLHPVCVQPAQEEARAGVRDPAPLSWWRPTQCAAWPSRLKKAAGVRNVDVPGGNGGCCARVCQSYIRRTAAQQAPRLIIKMATSLRSSSRPCSGLCKPPLRSTHSLFTNTHT